MTMEKQKRIWNEWKTNLIPGYSYDVYTPISVGGNDAELKLNNYLYIGYEYVEVDCCVGLVPHFEFRHKITSLPIRISAENLTEDSYYQRQPIISCTENQI